MELPKELGGEGDAGHSYSGISVDISQRSSHTSLLHKPPSLCHCFKQKFRAALDSSQALPSEHDQAFTNGVFLTLLPTYILDITASQHLQNDNPNRRHHHILCELL